MPKPLNHTPPSSAAARMLQPTDPPEVPESPASNQSGGRLTEAGPHASRRITFKREFALSQDSDEALDVLVRAFRRGTATRINNSQAMRPMLEVVAEVAQSLEQVLITQRPWRMPSNAAGYDGERAEFNDRLQHALRDALARLNEADLA